MNLKEAYEQLYPTNAAKRVRDSMQGSYSKLLAGTTYHPDWVTKWTDGKTGRVSYTGKYENKTR
jgi:hypothetical protein